MVEEWVSLCTLGNFLTSMCLSTVPCYRGASSKSKPRKFKLEEALRTPLVLSLIFRQRSGAQREKVRVPRGGEKGGWEWGILTLRPGSQPLHGSLNPAEQVQVEGWRDSQKMAPSWAPPLSPASPCPMPPEGCTWKPRLGTTSCPARLMALWPGSTAAGTSKSCCRKDTSTRPVGYAVTLTSSPKMTSGLKKVRFSATAFPEGMVVSPCSPTYTRTPPLVFYLPWVLTAIYLMNFIS